MKNCNFLSQMLVADYMPVKEFMPLSSIGTTLIWAMLLMPVMNTVNVLQVRFNLPFFFKIQNGDYPISLIPQRFDPFEPSPPTSCTSEYTVAQRQN